MGIYNSYPAVTAIQNDDIILIWETATGSLATITFDDFCDSIALIGVGSVTDVSVVSANGVSGTVADPSTTPAITLSLGAITPTTVNGNTITIGTGTLTLGSATLNAGAGGTLGSAAFQNTTAFQAANGTLTTISGKSVTGSGDIVLATSPTLTTPTLGVATATSLNGNIFTTGTGTLTFAASKVLTISKTLTLTGTDGTTITFPSTSATVARTDAANSFSGTQTFAGPVYVTSGIQGANATSVMPITLFVKSVTVLTAGSAADIATITVPAGITRYRIVGSSTANSANMVVAETASGSLSSAQFIARDAASGGGNQLTSAISGPSGSGIGVSWSSNLTDTVWTSSTIYIRQAANSLNAGTCSFYITIWPLP